MNGKEFYILLDVLYEDNHYERLVEYEIQNKLLITEAEMLKDYSLEIAVTRAAKTAYVAVCLMADVPYERVVDCSEYINKKFTQQKLMIVKYLRKVNPEAYAYMTKVDRILDNHV